MIIQEVHTVCSAMQTTTNDPLTADVEQVNLPLLHLGHFGGIPVWVCLFGGGRGITGNFQEGSPSFVRQTSDGPMLPKLFRLGACLGARGGGRGDSPNLFFCHCLISKCEKMPVAHLQRAYWFVFSRLWCL